MAIGRLSMKVGKAGKAGPRIFQTFPLAEAAAAHRLMESSEHIGKIMLEVAG